MEKFEGNGAECMVKFIADGCKGHILVGNRMVFGEVAWRVKAEKEVWTIDWLAEPCTYTPPEPVWKECTAGEALDAVMQKGNVQLCLMGENAWVDVPAGWTGWTTKLRKYRKEA